MQETIYRISATDTNPSNNPIEDDWLMSEMMNIGAITRKRYMVAQKAMMNCPRLPLRDSKIGCLDEGSSAFSIAAEPMMLTGISNRTRIVMIASFLLSGLKNSLRI